MRGQTDGMNNLNPLSAIQFIAEKRIEEAQAKGDFDSLPGQGQPLQLEDTSHIPEELRMAYKILRNANCLPPELAERKEMTRLADMLEHCADEQERVRLMQKLRLLVARVAARQRRPLYLEENDCYYTRILNVLAKHKKDE
jgi:hypothetical protein